MESWIWTVFWIQVVLVWIWALKFPNDVALATLFSALSLSSSAHEMEPFLLGCEDWEGECSGFSLVAGMCSNIKS